MANNKIIRRHLIEKAMEKILHMKNEVFKKEQENYLDMLKADESGLAAVKFSTGKIPSFSAPAIDQGDGTFISINLEMLKDKDPELFEALLAKYPTEVKTRCADSVSVTCTQKCLNLAAEELNIEKEQLEDIQNKAKQYKVK